MRNSDRKRGGGAASELARTSLKKRGSGVSHAMVGCGPKAGAEESNNNESRAMSS
jgi:hypothetical protein